jgi:NAD(P)-dependent dehydrogenase (short-subunit alcohol dehydrogenase family)
MHRFEGSSSAGFAKLLDVDVLGTYLVCKAALPHLRATGNGSIVNFATAYGPGLNPDNPANSLSARSAPRRAPFALSPPRSHATSLRRSASTPWRPGRSWRNTPMKC